MSKIKFHKNHVRNLIFLGCGIVVAGLYYSYRRTYLAPTPISIAEIAQGGTVTLSLLPKEGKIIPNPKVKRAVELNVDSGTDHLSAVQIELEFDPTKLKISDFTSTGVMPVELEAPVIDQNGGKLTVTFGADPNSGTITGEKNLALFYIEGLVPGDASINFGPNSQAAAGSLTTNNLGVVVNATYHFNYPGDITGDNKVNIYDYGQFLNAFNKTGDPGFDLADFNASGKVDIYDYSIFLANFNKDYNN